MVFLHFYSVIVYKLLKKWSFAKHVELPLNITVQLLQSRDVVVRATHSDPGGCSGDIIFGN